ncbi:MAG: TPM domain-containing protein [Lachnospiraceae bacterium]|nr:TPM domain-containing protein [Lachnospiraceae bacterium]
MKIKRQVLWAAAFIFSVIVFSLLGRDAFASDNIRYTNPDNSFIAVIEDNADLLTEYEEDALLQVMIPLTKYGSIGFISTDSNSTSARYYAEERSHANFGRMFSQSVFLVDMDNREIFVYSDGANYKVITDKKGTIITDNIYTYASAKDYYTCAYKAYEQMYALLEGRKIMEPMRIISAVLISVLTAMLICFIIVNSYAKLKTVSMADLLGSVDRKLTSTQPKVTLTKETKTYSPQSSGSSGGGHSGGGHHSSGGHSGGGHSGGGGGHRF